LGGLKILFGDKLTAAYLIKLTPRTRPRRSVEELQKTITYLKLLKFQDGLVAAIDILIVSFLFYRFLMLVRGTRFWRILMGIIIYLFVLEISGKIGLRELNWVLLQAFYLGPVALVILFLPELRQAIEGLGKLDKWTQHLGVDERPRSEARTIEDLVAAVAEMAAGKVGALIVVEKEANLDHFVENGVTLNARLSTPLLVSIFYDQNPLHDGAVIVRRDTIVAAACRLPVSENMRLDQSVHLRHRAAVGITENTDCFVIVVSEERGTISVAMDGKLSRLEGHNELRDFLNHQLRLEKKNEEKPKRLRERRHEVGGKTSDATD
jgi:diadenylate cyclase